MKKLKFYPFDELQELSSLNETEKLLDLMCSRHSLYLEDEIFELKSGFNQEQLQIEICLKKNDTSVIYPIEIVCIHQDYPDLKMEEILLSIIDYIDLYWTEYFNSERNIYVPLDWSEYQFEGVTFFLRGFIRNLSLEKQADFFLNEYGFGDHTITSISSET
jgi:hypothetical protein